MSGECIPDARITVEGASIPYVDEGVQTTVSKDGVGDVQKVTEIVVPAEWRGEDVTSRIPELNGSGGSTATVELRAQGTETFVPVHSGFVRGVGGGGRGKVRIQIGDYAELFKSLGASKQFGKGTSAEDVAKWVRDELVSRHGLVDSMDVASIEGGIYDSVFVGTGLLTGVSDVTEDVGGAIEGVGETIDVGREGFFTAIGDAIGWGLDTGFTGARQFRGDRDTLADVMDWLCNKIGGFWYVMAVFGTPTLIVDTNPANRTEAASHEFGDDITIRQNNALYQINPLASLRVKGHVPRGVINDVARQIGFGNNEYPVAIANYGPLTNRLGGAPEDPITIKRDATSVDEAKNIAKRELKKRLDNAAGGTMKLALTPSLVPYVGLNATPVSRCLADTDVNAITYEIEEVRHHVHAPRAENDYEAPFTEVSCSLHVDPSQMNVTGSTVTEGETVVGGSGEPAGGSPDAQIN